MALQRVSVDDACKDGYTCPSVWVDSEIPDRIVVVGVPCRTGTPALEQGLIAVRVRRQVLEDAGFRAGHASGADHAVVVGIAAPDGAVPVGAGELAVSARGLVRF